VKGAQTLVAAVTDRLSAVLKIGLDTRIIQRGRCFWRPNTALLHEEEANQRLETECNKWETDATSILRRNNIA
jgi:hypothetical protein